MGRSTAYGTPLKLPGEFFENGTFTQEPDIFVQELRNCMRLIRPQPTAHHGKRTSFTHRQLMESSHVFVRDDATKRPLQPAYSGPHEVIARISDRVFTVQINSRNVISTERLKPAYLPPDDPPVPTTADISLREPVHSRKLEKHVQFAHITAKHSRGSDVARH